MHACIEERGPDMHGVESNGGPALCFHTEYLLAQLWLC
jgi:hypothetical protein